MNRSLVVMLAFVPVIGCHRRSADAANEAFVLTPAQWDSGMAWVPACAPATAPAPPYRSWKLERPAATFPLPADLHEIEPQRAVRRWAAPESTQLELWASSEPEGGLATRRNVRVSAQAHCRATIAGHVADTFSFQLDDTTRAQTIYAAAIASEVAPGVAINASIESLRSDRRDAVVSALTRMALDRP